MSNGPQENEIEIVHLGSNQEPVDEPGWILVENAASGVFVKKSIGKGRSTAASIQGPFASGEDGFESATRQARELGFPVVYAKGFPHAFRAIDDKSNRH